MAKWHRGEADKIWPTHATVDAYNSNKRKLDGGA